MNHKLLAFTCAVLSTLAAAGCKPQAPAEPAAPATPESVGEPAPTAMTPAAAATAATAGPGSAPALDRKGFAGRFVGGSASVTLTGDGEFSIKQGAAAFDGTWTAEADGARIRLDPNSKAEPDRLYGVTGKDEIRPIDAAGQPLADGIPLQRADSEY